MKKFILTSVVALGLVVSFGTKSAFAATPAVCGDNVTPATYDSGGVLITATTTVTLNCTNGNPLNVVNGWGLTGAQSLKMSVGAFATDENGATYQCETWILQGCYDITHTWYYHNYMVNLGHQLVSNGFSAQFPQFSYWWEIATLRVAQ